MRTHTRDDFSANESVEFPLMDEGEVWYQGWDIPGHWAIDAQGRAFADFGAHGCCMHATEIRKIVYELESSDDVVAAARLRTTAGLKPALPPWITVALRQGWTPPATFRREDYE